MKDIGNILDWIIKTFERFQKILFLVILTFTILSIAGNGCQRSDIVNLTEKLTGMKISLERLNKENGLKNELIAEKDDRIQDLEIKLDSVKKREAQTKASEKLLLTENRKLKDNILKISEDSSYKWLQQVAYPFGGDYKPFGFNGPQVKAIHSDKIDYEGQLVLNENLRIQVAQCNERYELKDSLEMTARGKIALLEDKEDNYQEMLTIREEEGKIKEKDCTKQERRKKIWRAATAITGALALAALAL